MVITVDEPIAGELEKIWQQYRQKNNAPRLVFDRIDEHRAEMSFHPTHGPDEGISRLSSTVPG
ncbi:MAG: hypothetical protein ABSH09_35295 [Bryobacteraceae bacterium]|jgi:hypothetical protein